MSDVKHGIFHDSTFFRREIRHCRYCSPLRRIQKQKAIGPMKCGPILNSNFLLSLKEPRKVYSMNPPKNIFPYIYIISIHIYIYLYLYIYTHIICIICICICYCFRFPGHFEWCTPQGFPVKHLSHLANDWTKLDASKASISAVASSVPGLGWWGQQKWWESLIYVYIYICIFFKKIKIIHSI